MGKNHIKGEVSQFPVPTNLQSLLDMKGVPLLLGVLLLDGKKNALGITEITKKTNMATDKLQRLLLRFSESEFKGLHEERIPLFNQRKIKFDATSFLDSVFKAAKIPEYTPVGVYSNFEKVFTQTLIKYVGFGKIDPKDNITIKEILVFCCIVINKQSVNADKTIFTDSMLQYLKTKEMRVKLLNLLHQFK